MHQNRNLKRSEGGRRPTERSVLNFFSEFIEKFRLKNLARFARVRIPKVDFFEAQISVIVAAIACILALLIVMVARIVTQKRQGLAPTSFFTSPFCATRNFTVPYNFGFPNPLFQTRKKRFSITAAFCLTTENECRRDMISISQNFLRCSHCSKPPFFVQKLKIDPNQIFEISRIKSEKRRFFF